MTRRVKTKKDREFKIISQETREDGQVDMDIRVKNRPGRKHGGPMWNDFDYPMSVQQRIADELMKQKQTTQVEQPEETTSDHGVEEPPV